MTTTPTQLPVPSEKPQDLKFNAGKIDEFVTSMGWTYTDRFGNKHYTIAGINYLAQQVMNAFGYITLTGVDFDTGATISTPNEVLFNPNDNSYYKWTGSFASGAKLVPANSTPQSTGGIGPGKWLSVGDTVLRNDLVNQGVINFSHSETYDQDAIGAHLQNVVYPTDAPFNAVGDGVADDTNAIKQAIAHCVDNNKALVMNNLFKITDTITVSDGLLVNCLTIDCGIYSEVGIGKFAVNITGSGSGWRGGTIHGQNLPTSTAIRQDGVSLDASSSDCKIIGANVYGFYAKGIHAVASDGMGMGISDKGTRNTIEACIVNSKFCIGLEGKSGKILKNEISNKYLSSGEAKPWSYASNYWDGIVSENAQGYLIAFNDVKDCGQSGIYFGGNGGYSVDNIIAFNSVGNCWNRGIDQGLFKSRSPTNDVRRNLVVGNNLFNNRENNIWLAGVSDCSVLDNTSWFDSNYDTLFAGYPGGHICISIGDGAEGDHPTGNKVDGNTCIDPTGSAGIVLLTGATGNVIGSGNNLSKAGDFFISTPALITNNRFELSVSGSFTPVLLPASGSITLSPSSTAVYRAVGKRIEFAITLNISAISSPSGTINLGYLPGMSGKTSSISMFHIDYWNNMTFSTGVIPLASLNAGNQDQITIYRNDGGRVLYDLASLLTSTSSLSIKGFVDFN